MSLLDEMCRCHDGSCERRTTCLRSLYRETGPRAPHSWSLREWDEDDGQPPSDECRHYLAATEEVSA